MLHRIQLWCHCSILKLQKKNLACGENHIIIKKRYRDFIEISKNNHWLYLNACISQLIEVMKTSLPQSCLLKSWIENKIETGLISESVLTKSMDSCILTGHFNCTVWKRCWRTKKDRKLWQISFLTFIWPLLSLRAVRLSSPHQTWVWQVTQ